MPEFRKEWLLWPQQYDDFKLAKAILNHINSINEFTPDEAILNLLFDNEIYTIENGSSILDFGCGLGRNMTGALKASEENGKDWKIFGYDNKHMIARAKKLYSDSLNGAIFLSEISEVKKRNFDVTIASLSLQHMNINELRSNFEIISECSKYLIAFGRRATDDLNNVWKECEKKFELIWSDENFQMIGRNNDHNYTVWKSKKENIVYKPTENKTTEKRKTDRRKFLRR